MGATWKSVNRNDFSAKASKFGVFKTGLPRPEKSPSPWSSVITIKTFGFVAASAATLGAMQNASMAIVKASRIRSIPISRGAFSADAGD
jgi:hypothetical protein